MGQRQLIGGQRQLIAGAVAGVIGVLCVFLALGLRSPRASQHASTVQKPLTAAKPLTGVVVVIDPGHGGADPGATVGPLSEAALSYRTACELAACLHTAGASVVYTVQSGQLNPALAVAEPFPTRPTDAVLAVNGLPLRLRHSPRPLWQRAAAANAVWVRQGKHDPQARRNVFFVSLHYDQFCQPGVHGGVVCVDRRVSHTPALALALAQQMVRGNFARSGEFRGVRGLAGRKLGVLSPDYNPIPEKVLIELATLSNPENAAEAANPAWRIEMAHQITEAVTQVHQSAVGEEKVCPEISSRLAARPVTSNPEPAIRPDDPGSF